MKKVLIAIIIILIIIIAVLLGILVYKILYNETENVNNEVDKIPQIVGLTTEENQPKIFNGNQRPIAVMIDNVGEALPQAGLNDAYIVYEIIVEGKQTRLMALFKNKEIKQIGPVRSSRHYFLDYALENDAIYVHYGWSPKAKSDISTLNIDNINGITESSQSFWRVNDKPSPHNVVTSTDKILEIAKRNGYSLTSEKESVLDYSTDEVILDEGNIATTVEIPYSSSYKVIYKYDEQAKKYTRIYNKTTQKDWLTKELITAKNIIITFAKNSILNDGTNKDRQNLSNIGNLNGYYITNGKAIKIKCYKSSRTAQTVYKDLEGNEIKVNDGNTFIQIVPIDSEINIQ